MEELSELFIKMLHLSLKLEYAMVLHYRPRRPPLSVAQLEADCADTLRLPNGLDREIKHKFKILTLHMNHF